MLYTRKAQTDPLSQTSLLLNLSRLTRNRRNLLQFEARMQWPVSSFAVIRLLSSNQWRALHNEDAGAVPPRMSLAYVRRGTAISARRVRVLDVLAIEALRPRTQLLTMPPMTVLRRLTRWRDPQPHDVGSASPVISLVEHASFRAYKEISDWRGLPDGFT